MTDSAAFGASTVPEKNSSAKSADAQGSNVPLKWKPTVAEPVPVVRCTAIKRDGVRCGRWSLRGATLCIKHGGRLPNVQDHAAAVVEAARLRLVGLSDKAIDQIEDLLENASAEGIRLKAAQDVLDRNGVKGAIEIDVTVTQTETAAERVQKRLAEIASRIPTKEINVESVVISDEIVIEGNPNDS